MPTPGELRPIQRVQSGLPGPGGTGLSPCAQGDAGGDHQGFRPMTTISQRASGVGYAGCPTATPKVCHERMPWYRLSRCALRWMTITGPKLLRETAGASFTTGSLTGAAALAASAFASTVTARRWSIECPGAPSV